MREVIAKRTIKSLGVKKGYTYPLIEDKYGDWFSIKVRVKGEDIWFRGYYFEEVKK